MKHWEQLNRLHIFLHCCSRSIKCAVVGSFISHQYIISATLLTALFLSGHMWRSAQKAGQRCRLRISAGHRKMQSRSGKTFQCFQYLLSQLPCLQTAQNYHVFLHQFQMPKLQINKATVCSKSSSRKPLGYDGKRQHSTAARAGQPLKFAPPVMLRLLVFSMWTWIVITWWFHFHQRFSHLWHPTTWSICRFTKLQSVK